MGADYTLLQNNGTNCLHGGKWSFDNMTWDVVSATSDSVKMTYKSVDMEEGFPGNLVVVVEFSFKSVDSTNSALVITYHAETDKATVLNLTNHAYFNLIGHTGGETHPTILDHLVAINSDAFLQVDENCIPVCITDVTGTPFDFRQPKRAGADIEQGDSQLIYCNGYDHCFVLATGAPKVSPEGTPQGMRDLGVTFDSAGVPKKTRCPDAVLFDPSSGRRMETFTEEPGVHFFTDNIPNDVLGMGGAGKHGVKSYTYRTGACFETQHYPDSPNKPSFPSTVLRPGNPYDSRTVYWFTVSGTGSLE